MNRFYNKSFTFRATHFEQWQGGFCTANGPISTFIRAEVTNQKISFSLEGTDYLEIHEHVEMDLSGSCILHDRIQYVKGSCQWDSNEPMVCHLFIRDNHIHCVRFAMTAPDRIIEFYGMEESLGEISKSKTRKLVHSAEDIVNQVMAFCKDDPYNAIMEKAAQMIDDHYRVESEIDYVAFVEIIKLYHAANTILDSTRKDNSFFLYKGQLLAHLAMCQKAIGNELYAFKLARRSVYMFREWQKTSVFHVSSCDAFGENKATSIIDEYEEKYPDSAKELHYGDINEYELDLTNYNIIIETLREHETLKHKFSVADIKQLLSILMSEYAALQQHEPADLFEKLRVAQVESCIGNLNAALIYFLIHINADVDPKYCMKSYLQDFVDNPQEALTFMQYDNLFNEIITVLQREIAFDIDGFIDALSEII